MHDTNNDSRVHSTVINDEINWKIVIITTECTVIMLSLSTVIYGMISWCIIKDFRNYRNFIILNAIIANILFYFISIIVLEVVQKYTESTSGLERLVIMFPLFYFMSAKYNWLLVICHMFYVKIVKGIDGHIQRNYLKSSLFAWGIALVTTTIYLFVSYFFDLPEMLFKQSLNLLILNRGIQFLPLIVNCGFYIIIVYTLCRRFYTSRHTVHDIWLHLYIAILIFVMSDIVMISECVISMISPRAKATTKSLLLKLFIYNINSVLLPVFFVVVKSNRQVWYVFYVSKIQRSLLSERLEHDINMNARIIREQADNRLAVSDV